MRALLVSLPLLFLAACGDDSPPSGSGMKIKLDDGQTIDIGAMQAAAERAKAMAARPLTPADVERFLEVMPEMKRLGSKEEDKSKILEKRGVFLAEWGALTARVMAAYQVLKHAPDSGDAKVKADAEVVRPFMGRIEAAMNAK